MSLDIDNIIRQQVLCNNEKEITQDNNTKNEEFSLEKLMGIINEFCGETLNTTSDCYIITNLNVEEKKNIYYLIVFNNRLEYIYKSETHKDHVKIDYQKPLATINQFPMKSADFLRFSERLGTAISDIKHNRVQVAKGRQD